MAPVSEFSLRVQKGITGGFAPPTPSAIHTMTKVGTASTVQIHSSHRPDGEALLQDLGPKTVDAAHAEQLVEELHSILSDIPTEEPAGSEDIYGMDTSIAFGSESLMWCNGGPAGCGGGTSSVRPSAEQKAKFKRAVEICDELVSKAK